MSSPAERAAYFNHRPVAYTDRSGTSTPTTISTIDFDQEASGQHEPPPEYGNPTTRKRRSDDGADAEATRPIRDAYSPQSSKRRRSTWW